MNTDEKIQTISADPEQMRDVVLNLLLNAIEAVEENTGKIDIQTEMDINSKQVALHVADNGKGLEDTDRIFDPFYTTKPNVGTGLGLAIVQKVIHNHHGTIKVQSLPAKGTTFTVRLPIAVPNR